MTSYSATPLYNLRSRNRSTTSTDNSGEHNSAIDHYKKILAHRNIHIKKLEQLTEYFKGLYKNLEEKTWESVRDELTMHEAWVSETHVADLHIEQLERKISILTDKNTISDDTINLLKSQKDEYKEHVSILEKQLDNTRKNLSCTICRDSFRDTLIMPCNHLVACELCVESIQNIANPRCPTCRGPIDETCKIFMN